MELFKLNLISESEIGLFYEVIIKHKKFKLFSKNEFYTENKKVFVKKLYDVNKNFLCFDNYALETLNFDEYKFGRPLYSNYTFSEHLRNLIIHDFKLNENKDEFTK